MAIVKQGMSHGPSNDGEMMSHINFKLTFSKRALDLVRGFLLKFGVI